MWVQGCGDILEHSGRFIADAATKVKECSILFVASLDHHTSIYSPGILKLSWTHWTTGETLVHLSADHLHEIPYSRHRGH